jgi:hypothetical protein
MSTIHLQVAPRVGPAYPRGSRLAAAAFLLLYRGVSALAAGAAAHARQPEQDLRQVRDLACSLRERDPGFAADLSAAADHCERQRGLG